jgi:hypothetical protein
MKCNHILIFKKLIYLSDLLNLPLKLPMLSKHLPKGYLGYIRV